jgi:hypothetical protein
MEFLQEKRDGALKGLTCAIKMCSASGVGDDTIRDRVETHINPENTCSTLVRAVDQCLEAGLNEKEIREHVEKATDRSLWRALGR